MYFFSNLWKRINADPLVLRLVRNVGMLLTGSFLGSFIGLISTSLIISRIGAGYFGMIALAQGYALIVDGVLNFQSWEAVIKLGAEVREREDELAGVFRVGFLLDASTAILGFVIAFFGAELLVSLFHWDPSTIGLFRLFSFTILFNIQGTPIGILRLFNRFHVFAAQRIGVALFKLIIVVVIFFGKAPPIAFAIAIAVSEIADHLIVTISALSTLRKNGLSGWWRGRLHSWKSVFTFAVWSNLTRTASLPSKEMDKFIVSLISIEAVGVYKLFKQIGQIIRKLANPIYQAIYPEFSSLVSEGNIKRARRFVRKISLTISGVSILPFIVVVATAPYWLTLLLGAEFVTYWSVLAFYLTWQVISASMIAVDPLFVATGHIRSKFVITATSNVLYLLIAIPLVTKLQLNGLVIALATQGIFTIGTKLWIMRDHKKTA